MQSVPSRGTVIWIRQRRWTVEAASRDRDVVRLDVTSAGRRCTFLSPFDRVMADTGRARPIRARRRHFAARLSALIGATASSRSLSTAVSAQIEILPHQLEPALAIVRGDRRVLIADDVGLGKTVQAALVLAGRRERDAASRMLIVAPASLCHQWADELLGRFALPSLRVDAATLDLVARQSSAAQSPLEQPGIWIA